MGRVKAFGDDDVALLNDRSHRPSSSAPMTMVDRVLPSTSRGNVAPELKAFQRCPFMHFISVGADCDVIQGRAGLRGGSYRVMCDGKEIEVKDGQIWLALRRWIKERYAQGRESTREKG